MVSATHGNIPLNNDGHYVKSQLSHSDKERSCHGTCDGQINGDWRKRHNEKPSTVTHKEVDTLACL